MAWTILTLVWLSMLFRVSLADPTYPTLNRRQNASPAVPPLRILPLGASVTFGAGSTTGNSYRKDLRDLLVGAGYTVNYVGSKKNGMFVDNDVEATNGFVIAQIAKAAAAAVPRFQPNLMLLDAGTNNCNKGGSVPDAGANVTALVRGVYGASPGATVVLASLLVNKDAKQDACRVGVNAQYDAVAAALHQEGAKFVYVDMRGPDAPTRADLNDTRHPNDAGYVKMANVWLGGINRAISSGFITPAAVVEGIPDDGGA